MAQFGTAEAFSRYDGISVGRVMAYLFESQEGVPVDGTKALLRQLSPFRLRFVPPDDLLSSTEESEGEDVGLIGAAARWASSDADRVAEALNSSYPVTSATRSSLESVLAGGLNTNLSPGDFYPALADIYAAADITLQLKSMLEAPPLVLLVNPESLSIAYSKVQSFGTKTRDSSLFESWGEEQPTLSISGSTAGFVAGAASSNSTGTYFGDDVVTLSQSTGETTSVSGYQEASRRDSAGWQNFMALYLFYRNNGYIFDNVNHTDANHFIGAIAIDYDQWTYVGHFESFSFGFEENSPLRVTWEAEFKVDRMYDHSSVGLSVLPQTPPTSAVDLATTPFELL